MIIINKTLFIILDGAAEKGKSAYSIARKPNLDFLAQHSVCGLWRGPIVPRGYNIKSLSDVATLELLGYSWHENPGRGYLEALGIGLKPEKNAIYLRANFATVKNGKIVDRRAGRDEKGLDMLSKKLNMKIDGVQIKFRRSVGHRGVLVLSGKGLSAAITDGDIGKKTIQKIYAKNPKGKKTAKILNEFLKKSNEVLGSSGINKKRKMPANYILIRGAGSVKKIESFKSKFFLSGCSISGVGIMSGISRYIGIDVLKVKGATGKLDTNLKAKIHAAINALEKYDFVILHINGLDICGHSKDFKGKARFLEKIDRDVFSQMLKLKHINIVIASDHETSSKSGEHMFGPVPILLYSPKGITNKIKIFDEVHCKKGFFADNPMRKMMMAFK